MFWISSGATFQSPTPDIVRRTKIRTASHPYMVIFPAGGQNNWIIMTYANLERKKETTVRESRWKRIIRIKGLNSSQSMMLISLAVGRFQTLFWMTGGSKLVVFATNGSFVEFIHMEVEVSKPTILKDIKESLGFVCLFVCLFFSLNSLDLNYSLCLFKDREKKYKFYCKKFKCDHN